MKKDKLPKRLRRHTIAFLDAVEAKRLRRNLTNLLFIYSGDLNIGIPLYHNDLIHDLEFLFYFLDEVEKEQRKMSES